MLRRFFNFRSPSRRTRRRPSVQTLETRSMLAADSIGVLPTDNAEFLLGRVVVTPVFFESDGSIDTETQNWTESEIEATIDKIADAVNWWSDTLDALNTVHSLEFVLDTTWATNPFDTPLELIDRPSEDTSSAVGSFLTTQGYGGLGSISAATHAFNHQQRIDHEADWSFTMYVVDSSDDSDGFFASGGNFRGAFAFPGGLYYVSPSERPTSTFTHELGHIFWARDEYPGGGSYTDRRGYYNSQNLNAHDNPTPGFVQQPSIMGGGEILTDAFNSNTSPESTLAFVGWQDSDGDGIFDVADVPHYLEGLGTFDQDTNVFQFNGSVEVRTLANQNPSGNQSDITLNRVSEIQYSLDDGPWQTAHTLDAQIASLDFSFTPTSSFEVIRLRAIDGSNGVVSNEVIGTNLIPATEAESEIVLLIDDVNGDGVWQASETALDGYTVTANKTDQSPVQTVTANAADFSDGSFGNNQVKGLTFRATGILTNGNVNVFEFELASEIKAFHAFSTIAGEWDPEFNELSPLEIDFDSPTGLVTVGLAGPAGGGFGRIEAYDADGNFIRRVTSSDLEFSQQQTLEINDAEGRIASIRIIGQGSDSILVTSVSAGVTASQTVGTDGTARFALLPEDATSFEFAAQNLKEQFVIATAEEFTLPSDSPATIYARQIVDSPLYNTTEPLDVNQVDGVSPLDALLIINELTSNGTRLLTESDLGGDLFDTNNDGFVSPLDALLVINALTTGSSSGEGEQALAQSSQAESVAPPNDVVFATASASDDDDFSPSSLF
ncbi:MAG: dockerin type I domain-containing protein [Planctomycetota bacterium]